MELQGRLESLRAAGLGVVAISYDPVPVLADFASRRGITFPILSDAGSAVIGKYGLLNTTVDPNDPLFGYPFPGTFILDAQGRVKSRFFEETYQERNTIASILVRLGQNVSVPATIMNVPHLSITSFTTDQTVAPGTHFSLVLDIVPGERIHVYAPGVTDYKPIALTLAPTPGVILRAAQFPKSSDYYFEPLDEHVPVYDAPFRIAQDVMIDPTPQGQIALGNTTTLTIRGTLAYQACDDKICYNPQTVPLTWTVNLRQLDRERTTVRP